MLHIALGLKCAVSAEAGWAAGVTTLPRPPLLSAASPTAIGLQASRWAGGRARQRAFEGSRCSGRLDRIRGGARSRCLCRRVGLVGLALAASPAEAGVTSASP